jgi:hypothetical protein
MGLTAILLNLNLKVTIMPSDDPLPAFWAGFHCGGFGCYSLCGVNGFVLGVVVGVGYRPTDSSDVGKPLPEAPPQAPNTPTKLGLTNLSL